MSEKRKIEKSTAEQFLRLYNTENALLYRISSCGDSPDVICRDPEERELRLEITLTQDKDEDIAAALGRSNSRSVEVLKESLRNGKARSRVSCLQGNVLDNLVETISKKLNKDYGPDTALVVRSVSDINWSWENIIVDLKDRLDLSHNPYDRGIWLLNKDGD